MATNELAAALGLGAEVRESVYQTFERWDGKGVPAEAKGEQILHAGAPGEARGRGRGLPPRARGGRGGRGRPRAPRHAVRPGAGGPVLRRGAALFERHRLGDDVACGDRGGAGARVVLSDAELESALEAIADFTDLKSPWTIGHSRGVADLAYAAAARYGLSDGDATLVRRAGLVHDLGRLGVSNAIWDKPGALTPAERERVRLHPYLTERMLASSARAGAARCDRRPAPRAPRRLGLSARALRRRDDAGRAGARRGRRLPRDDRAAAPPPGARPRGGGGASCAPASGEAPRRRRRRRGAARRRPRGEAPARVARGPHAREVEVLGCSCAASRTRRSPSSW